MAVLRGCDERRHEEIEAGGDEHGNHEPRMPGEAVEDEAGEGEETQEGIAAQAQGDGQGEREEED